MAPTTVDTTAYNYISAGNTKHRYFVDRQFALLEKHKCLRWLAIRRERRGRPTYDGPRFFCVHQVYTLTMLRGPIEQGPFDSSHKTAL